MEWRAIFTMLTSRTISNCALHSSVFFFFNDTATTEIYTLSLHDALPISCRWGGAWNQQALRRTRLAPAPGAFSIHRADRKSTRLNSSHGYISYAVFCLKKKKTKEVHRHTTTPVALPHTRHPTTLASA